MIEAQCEPIPGYRLLERLGEGGFGEVWKAQAPGGLLKAIKIVHGRVHSIAGEDVHARQELKALDRVKMVRHPYILALDRYDIVADRLMIVMELADRSVWDRYQECCGQGLSGIPRDELLDYMEEAAEALDLMNGQYQLQHLDIKPQNLFLICNHIKVADFGLVKDLEGMQAQLTGGITPLYAAPETFEGVVTRFCDQYSLAVVYQELLTGQLPFTGKNPRQLLLQHVQVPPNVTPLPAHDREPIARALAKRPNARHPSCADLVRALRGRSAPRTPASPAGPTPKQSLEVARPELASTVVKRSEEIEPLPPTRPEQTGDGVLFPALVIGLGGLGLGLLQALRRALHKRYGGPAALPNIRFLHLDTDPDVLGQLEGGDTNATISEREVLLARLQRPAHYLKPGRERQAIEPWLPVSVLSRLPRDQVTPGGWRALGRLAFASNFAAISTRLRTELETCTAAETMAEAQKRSGLSLRTTNPRVYVLGSLAGGTGSGMFIDLAYAVRWLLRRLGYERPEVVGLLLLRVAEGKDSSSAAAANCFAALSELNYFSAQDRGYRVDYSGQGAVTSHEAPLTRCCLLPLPGEAGGAETLRELTTLAGDFLCRDLTTPLGRVADACRLRHATPALRMSAQSFGSFWFAVPRRLLLQRVAECLCHRLMQSWTDNQRTSSDGIMQSWVDKQLTARQLAPEELRQQLEEQCNLLLKQPAGVMLAALTNGWTEGGTSRLCSAPAAAYQMLADADRLLGSVAVSEGPAVVTVLEETLDRAVADLGEKLDQQLADLALCAVCEPQFRLTGLEGAVQERLIAELRMKAREQNNRADSLAQQAAAMRDSMAPFLNVLQERSMWARGKRIRAAQELLDKLPAFVSARWAMLLCARLSTLIEGLAERMERYVRNLSCCRPRINQFLQGFKDPHAPGQGDVDLGLGRYLLPNGCRTLSDAGAQMLAALSHEELLALEAQVQMQVGKALQDHIHLCTAPADFFKNLQERIYQEVAAFAEAQLTRAHAAEVYLEQNAEEDSVLGDLASAYDSAIPELTGSRETRHSEIRILAVPPGPEGERFRTLARRAMPETDLVPAASTDDVVFYREQPISDLTALPQLGPAGQKAYCEFLSDRQVSPYSRTDIEDWHNAAEAKGGH
jgi:hypothetical protein